MTPQEKAALWASQPAAIWLAGADRSGRHGIVIAWDTNPNHLAPLPCGVRWHALRTPDTLGLAALAALRATPAGTALGPVLHDQRTAATYWLLPVEPDTSSRWHQIDPALDLLGAGHMLEAPDPDTQTGIVHWINWPAVPGTLTPPDMLEAALQPGRPR